MNEPQRAEYLCHFVTSLVYFFRPMPDIDSLMQEWPPEFEELLGKVSWQKYFQLTKYVLLYDMCSSSLSDLFTRWISPQQTSTVIWQIMLILFVVSWSIACFLHSRFDAFVGYCNCWLSVIDCLCTLSGILDIPVYKNRIHSLHVLFTLYSEFKNSQVSFRYSTILNYILNMPSICIYIYFWIIFIM